MRSSRNSKILPAMLFIALSLSGRAQTHTWTGADPSGYWSVAANWSPAGAPQNGDDLVFPGGLPAENLASTNDLTGSFFRSISFSQAGGHTIRGNPITLTNRSDCIINSGTNVIACDLTFTGTPPTPNFQSPTIRDSSGSGELTVIGNVGGGSVSFFRQQFGTQARWIIRGQFTGGSLRVGYSTLALYGDNPNAFSAVVDHSILLVQGSQPNLNITLFSIPQKTLLSSSLRGEGQVGDVTGGTSYLDLDSTLAARNVSVTYVDIRLNGTDVGEYGRLVASGNVSASSGNITAAAGFNPQAGQVYTIVEKTSPGPVASAFFGLEGSVTTLNGMPFRISYVGGDGNDVTLTATNTPPSVTITNPANNAVFIAPATFTVDASALDAGGSVSQVQFFLDSTFLGTDTVSPYSANVNNLAAGTYTLSARAMDNLGARATNSITVTVNPRPIDSTFSDANWMSIGGIDGSFTQIRAAVVDGSGNLYIGGFFTISGVATNIAGWNGSRWSALDSGMTNLLALAVSGSDLYAGGRFWRAGGTPTTNIAKWDGSSWSALGSGVNGTVFALAVSGSNLYVGGDFTTAGGTSALNIAKWDGSSWSAVPGSGINRSVRALAVSGSDLHAAGIVTPGLTVNGVAKWDGSSWNRLGGDMGDVFALAVLGSDVYAGAAKWNGSSWIPLGSGVGEGFFANVWALAGLGNDLYAGGTFTTAGGSPANYIAKWDGNNWSVLGSGMNNTVYALALSGSSLYAGGSFTTAGGKASVGIAKARIASAAESITGSGSSATIQFSGVVGYEYHVQRTDSLTPPITWTTLTTNPLSPADDGSLTFTDTNAPPVAAYYRLMQN